jgi:uncharacterized membrane protein YphA (DoxX/SURF4 family)
MTAKDASPSHLGLERLTLIVLRCAIGGVFVWASIDKIVHPQQFARAVSNYHLLPGAAVPLFALVLPWVELLSGLLVLLGQWQRAASLVVASLLLVFIAAVGISIWRGLDIHCGCFDTSSGRRIGVKLLVEDLLLLGGAAFLALKSKDEVGTSAFLGSNRREPRG